MSWWRPGGTQTGLPRRVGGAPAAPIGSRQVRPALPGPAVTPHAVEPVHPEEISTKILQPLLGYLTEVYGEAEVEHVAKAAGLTPRDIRGGSGWISYAQALKIFDAARLPMDSDGEFLKACAHRLRESYGPVVLLLRATSVQTLWELLSRTMRVVSRVSRYEIVEGGRTWIRVRYTCDFATDTRLMCMSRQAQVTAFPTLWGLPAGQIEEGSCIAWGDSCCEYLIRWHDYPRWVPVALGAGLGIAVGTAIGLASALLPPVLSLALMGGLLGYVLELRRANKHNLRFSAETNQELHELTQSYVEAMEETLALSQRQRDWTRLLEEQVTERTTSFLELFERLQRLGQKRETTLRHLSHDLRSPLTVLKIAAEEMAERPDVRQLLTSEFVEDVDGAVNRLDLLVKEMLEFASEGGRTDLVKLTAVQMQVQPIVDRLRRRLRALVLGRNLRVSVFANREAPESIETDVLVFDRILDNLLTNAAKYTESGSIILELTGAPGILTVKVSDSGPGISDERIDHVFKVRGGEKQPARLGGSYGMGLSIVVRLLDQVGGRLEVMSKPNVGSTFWAHFPVRLPEVQVGSLSEDDSIEEIVGRVVTIRRLANG